MVRNRARRRVREVLQELVRDREVAMADGEYRLGIHAPLEALSTSELRATVSGLLRDVQR